MGLDDLDCSNIYIDGVFDLMHTGHFNALRQAKKLGKKLVVGINSDDECFRSKGCYPIYTQNERGELMKGCKWVDKIIIGTPYKVEESLLDELGCKFVAHGDDPVLCFDGSDPYLGPRLSGRLKIFHRTEGVSTTAVMTRIIRILGIGTQEDILPIEELDFSDNISRKFIFDENKSKLDRFLDGGYSPCQSLISTSRILGFAKDIIGSENCNYKTENVTYIDGSFDIFHIGHLRLLESAKKLFGGRLIIGIYDDATTKSIYGNGFPILKMMERALTLLSMRVVDDVIFGVPLKITTTLIETYKINHVVSCKFIENYMSLEHLNEGDFTSKNSKNYISKLEELCYEIPRKMGIFHDISLTMDTSICTNRDIFARFKERKDLILNNVNKKWLKEINFYRNRTNNPSFC